MSEGVLKCADLTVSAGDRCLVRELELTVATGEILAVLGPNGCGKSLTLRTLAGLRPAERGTVWLNGSDLRQLERRQIARQLGLLLQDDAETFPATVLESTLLGRHPHQSQWSGPGADDIAIARTALAELELGAFERRDCATLSGGERRRLSLARLLTQDPAVLLLDEPSNHLDPRHQISVMSRLKTLAGRGRAVVVSLHEPLLALRFAARTLLLFGDGRWELGNTNDVLTAETLAKLFATPYEEFRSRDRRVLIPLVPTA